MRKMPLSIVVSVKRRIETAVIALAAYWFQGRIHPERECLFRLIVEGSPKTGRTVKKVTNLEVKIVSRVLTTENY